MLDLKPSKQPDERDEVHIHQCSQQSQVVFNHGRVSAPRVFASTTIVCFLTHVCVLMNRFCEGGEFTNEARADCLVDDGGLSWGFVSDGFIDFFLV